MFSTILFFNTIRADKAAAPTPAMSNEEQMLAQQLDSVFEELTKGMSETEKNQFFNELNSAMEEEIDKMSKMSDDELTKYIQDAEKELQNLGQCLNKNIQYSQLSQWLILKLQNNQNQLRKR